LVSFLIIDIMVATPVRIRVVDDEDTSTGPGHAVAMDVPRQVVGLGGTPQRQDRVLQVREPGAWRELPYSAVREVGTNRPWINRWICTLIPKQDIGPSTSEKESSTSP